MARFGSGAPQTGVGAELQCIAAVVVGGTSLMGGRGTIVGTFFGALLIGVLNNVMNLAEHRIVHAADRAGRGDPARRRARRAA